MVHKVTNRTINEAVLSRRPGDAAALIANAGKIRAELGRQPRFADLESIVRAVWNWRQEKYMLN